MSEVSTKTPKHGRDAERSRNRRDIRFAPKAGIQEDLRGVRLVPLANSCGAENCTLFYHLVPRADEVIE